MSLSHFRPWWQGNVRAGMQQLGALAVHAVDGRLVIAISTKGAQWSHYLLDCLSRETQMEFAFANPNNFWVAL